MSFSNTILGRRWKRLSATSWWRRRQRHACHWQRGHTNGPMEWPRVDEIIEVGNLLRTLDALWRHGGQAPGTDGVRYGDLGRREATDILRVVSRSIGDGSYMPQTTRIVPIPKRDGGTRELRIGVIIDRV